MISNSAAKSNLLDESVRKTPEIHLIIQGPLASWSPKAKEDTPYNSALNVLSIVKQFGDEFKSVHIVTWKEEPTEALEREVVTNNLRNVHLQQIEDPGRGQDLFGPLQDNRLRQYVSTIAGIRAVEKIASNNDLCLKIRTDQNLDLVLLSMELRSILRMDPGKIVFPFALPYDLYSVGDFYIGGYVKQMGHFFQYLIDTLSYTVGSRSVHADIAQKYLRFRCAIQKFRFTLTGTDARRKGFVGVQATEVTTWAKFLVEDFGLFSRRAALEGTWRGHPIGPRKKYIFSDEQKQAKDIEKIIVQNSIRKIYASSFISRFVFQNCDSMAPGFCAAVTFKLKYFSRKILLAI